MPALSLIDGNPLVTSLQVAEAGLLPSAAPQMALTLEG